MKETHNPHYLPYAAPEVAASYDESDILGDAPATGTLQPIGSLLPTNQV